MRDSNNGKAVAAQDMYLYFSFAHSVERMYGGSTSNSSTIDDIGPWRHAGLPEGRKGKVVKLLPVLDWMFAALDAGEDGTSSVLVWNGKGWHEIFRAWTSGKRITNLFWQSITDGLGRPRLWIVVGGELVYIEFPLDTFNPEQDTGLNFTYESSITLSTFDMSRANLKKYYHELNLITRNDEAIDVGLDYQVDEDIGGDEWTVVRDFTQYPRDVLSIQEGNRFAIRPRLRIKCDDADVPTVIRAVVLEGLVRRPEKRQYNLRIRTSNYQVDRRGIQEAFSPDDLYNWLLEKARNAELLRMECIFDQMHDKYVVMESPVPLRDSHTPDTGSWAGEILLTIREA
jgi:hypothetical protein